jgi:hypothetical protein
MTENGLRSLPLDPPEEENARLREENDRLRRLLAVHGIPISESAPEKPPPPETIGTVPLVDKEERARKRVALFGSLFRGREVSATNSSISYGRRVTTSDNARRASKISPIKPDRTAALLKRISPRSPTWAHISVLYPERRTGAG